jgi:hypothetical protein
MARRYEPKKDAEIRSLPGTEEARDAWRFYLFTLAEELYPARFQELKRRALPIYRLCWVPADDEHATQEGSQGVEHQHPFPRFAGFEIVRDPADLPGRSNPQITACRWHARFRVPVALELERRIADWVKELRIVQSKRDSDQRSLWLRQLALKRLRAWEEGRKEVPVPRIIGARPLMIEPRMPGETRSDFIRRAKIAAAGHYDRAKVAADQYNPNDPIPWTHHLMFRHHFEWFLHNRIGGKGAAVLARDWDRRKGRKEHEEPTHTSVVQRGIKVVASLVDPSVSSQNQADQTPLPDERRVGPSALEFIDTVLGGSDS